MNKADYKVIQTAGLTFGNDKIFTGKNFRPSYVLSLSNDTVIVSIPIRIIDEAIKKLANSGENKEKTDFMKHFDWFYNFTQSLKSKFNNCMTKKIFYPGVHIITEGTFHQKAYVIVDGTCNIVCNNTS